MAVLSQGPRGLEATHIWEPGDGTASLTMNLLSAVPRIKFDAMPGFRSLPDAEDNRSPLTARAGEITYPSLVRGKTWTVEGRLQARSMDELRALEYAMMGAFGERDLLGNWHSVPVGDGSFWTCSARVLQYEPQTVFDASLRHPRGPHQISFLLGMRMSDPRFYWSVQQTATHASAVVALNEGRAPTDPIITVEDVGDTVIVANDTTGKTLHFNGINVAGDLVINFLERTASIGVVDAAPYLDPYLSDWWDRSQAGIVPGANGIVQSGGSSITVAYWHASW